MAIMADMNKEEIDTAGENSKLEVGETPILRSYKQDVANTMSDNIPETMSTLGWEEINRTQSRKDVQTEINSSKIFVIAILFLIGLGVGALGYVFLIHEAPPATIVRPTGNIKPSLITAEARTRISIESEDSDLLYRDIMDRINGAGLSLNHMEELIPENVLVDGESAVSISAENFIVSLGIKAPERLLRFIEKEFMFGIYALGETRAFLILKPLSFGPVFAELLSWETEIPETLCPLLTGKRLTKSEGTMWQDEIVKNIDVRVYKNKDGVYLIIYGFLPDKKLLVITSGLNTFNEVVLRSQASKPVEK